MMEAIMGHADLTGLRRWVLVASDAHELYKRFGFTGLASPERYMEIVRPDIYKSSA